MPSIEIQQLKPITPVLFATNPVNLIAVKEKEIEHAEKMIAEIEKIPEFSACKKARARGRLRFMKRFVELLKKGYVPIPRMPFDTLHEFTASIAFENLPLEALSAINQHRSQFDEIGIVRPFVKGRRKDPIIIGILKYGQLEEHFILAWWRPEIMKSSDLW